MDRTKLGLGLVGGLSISSEEQIRLIADVGFDSLFVPWSPKENIMTLKSIADNCGLDISSVHAPFMKIDKLWHPDDESKAVLNEQLECIRVCHDAGIPLAVLHVIIGFDRHSPTEEGLCAFRRIAEEARRLGVKLALENTEGEEYLASAMEHLSDFENVGFCYDTGHGICYNRGTDMLKLYGDRLAYTHINDNLGVSDAEGKITWLDDLHLLPFDGVLDVEKCVTDIAQTGFDGELTFELSVMSKPGRRENDCYAEMGAEAYLAEAFRRAERVRDIFDREKQKIIRNRT